MSTELRYSVLRTRFHNDRYNMDMEYCSLASALRSKHSTAKQWEDAGCSIGPSWTEMRAFSVLRQSASSCE